MAQKSGVVITLEKYATFVKYKTIIWWQLDVWILLSVLRRYLKNYWTSEGESFYGDRS
jgi:hypothetical protein